VELIAEMLRSCFCEPVDFLEFFIVIHEHLMLFEVILRKQESTKKFSNCAGGSWFSRSRILAKIQQKTREKHSRKQTSKKANCQEQDGEHNSVGRV
jgi:hypothetical protein